jgi:hypothetical protein
VGEPVALLVNPAWPEAAPEALGVNLIVTATLFPAAMVAGRLSPDRTNSELVDASDEMATAAFEAVSVACRLALDPTVTLPKLSVAGVTPSTGAALFLATPVPVRSIESEESSAVLLSVMTPVMDPLAVGLKMTGNSTLAPGWISIGRVKVPYQNTLLPPLDLYVMLRVVLPVFVSGME